ncbi:hypothetical protein C2S53_004690 [Perilla frutescens var. hirtella]|uniref:Uncharacterized protein n=1 Tax=Perilla frutescens var. hirtella TaxID=608512 RepID=A0AAD4J4M9_PERFH|nr:hypothetical protein C2S53_004690 [Perilla frutescens var. hirtella]
MGKNFLLAFLTLSAFFLTLHARDNGNGYPANPDPLSSRSRALLQNPEPERTIADPPSEKEAPSSAERAAGDEERETAAAEAPAEWESRKIGKHHSSDKSVAGGGVIIGGLVTAIFAAVYCYIRVTRRKHADNLT